LGDDDLEAVIDDLDEAAVFEPDFGKEAAATRSAELSELGEPASEPLIPQAGAPTGRRPFRYIAWTLGVLLVAGSLAAFSHRRRMRRPSQSGNEHADGS